MFFKKFLRLLALMVFMLGFINAATPVSMKLTKISDGDTFTFQDKGKNVVCRIADIDTPEKFESKKLATEAQKFGINIKDIVKAGNSATNYAKNVLFTGQSYKVAVLGTDKYKRSLCLVYLQNNSLYNYNIVKDGYAVVYKKGKYSKNKKLAHELNKAQGEAATNRRGLWKTHFELMKKMANN